MRGLCGTLTWSQHDDFTTPEGDVENSVSSFAQKFTSGHCSVPSGAPPDPCSTYTQTRHYAESVCSVIHSSVFQVMPRGNSFSNACSLCLCVSLSFIHSCMWLPDPAAVSRRGGEGAVFPPLSVGGLWLRSPESLSLHGPHCVRPTVRSGGRRCPMAQPHLLL